MTATAEEVWGLLREVVASQKDTDRKFQDTDRKFQETDRKLMEVLGSIVRLGNKLGEFVGIPQGYLRDRPRLFVLTE